MKPLLQIVRRHLKLNSILGHHHGPEYDLGLANHRFAIIGGNLVWSRRNQQTQRPL
jgi:hypothetical protein